MPKLCATGTYVEGRQVVFSHSPEGIVFAVDGNAQAPMSATELAEACSDYAEHGNDPTPIVETLGVQGQFSAAGEQLLADLTQRALDILGSPVTIPEWN